jgi:hypothetical protein
VHDQVNFWYALFNKTTQGAPLVRPTSQKTILGPHTLIGQTTLTWHNATIPLWAYYAQGIAVLCTQENCPQGPRWIQYTGETLAVTTANIMDYSNYAMSQVWTSTVPLFMNRETFDTTESRQTGNFVDFLRDWGRQEVVTELCVKKFFLETTLFEAGWETESTTVSLS